MGKALDMQDQSAGGSTLATQVEKYRHSPDGLTVSPTEKIRQMVSASVRAYRLGPETLEARKLVAWAYLNSVPLSAAPGYGEVHGLGDGLWVWFGANVDEVNRLLDPCSQPGFYPGRAGPCLAPGCLPDDRPPPSFLLPGAG